MEASPLAEWARLLFGSLAQAGLRDVVISPGSRSTPWVWAALNTPELRCHSILDERSAAFFALGQARITGRPSLLLCTSGTAAAHYFPAIIEARLTSTPLLLLTADRPFELQAAKAPQTIDQVKLFGDNAEYFELGMPDPHPEALKFARRLAFQALTRSTEPGARPIHINARARKPLEPQSSPILAGQVSAILAKTPPEHAPSHLECKIPDSLLRHLHTARGLLFSGPENPAAAGYSELLLSLAERTGWPIVVDAASPLRFRGNHPGNATLLEWAEWFLPQLAEEMRPEVIVQFGSPLVSSAVQQCLGAWEDSIIYAVTDGAWCDPQNGSIQLPSRPAELLKALLSHAPEAPSPEAQGYARLLKEANQRAARAVNGVLKEEGDFSEAHAVASIARLLPQGSLLALGNSLPIRDFGSFVARTHAQVAVLSQRGANGIDGLISGAAGAAEASGKPTTLVLGDLSFVHDLGGLWCCQALATPFVVVVLDNAGGRIFEQLPIQRSMGMTPEKLQSWVLSHELRLEKAGEIFGLHTERVSEAAALEAALGRAHAHAGPSLIVVAVAPSGAQRTSRRVAERLSAERLNSEQLNAAGLSAERFRNDG